MSLSFVVSRCTFFFATLQLLLLSTTFCEARCARSASISQLIQSEKVAVRLRLERNRGIAKIDCSEGYGRQENAYLATVLETYQGNNTTNDESSSSSSSGSNTNSQDVILTEGDEVLLIYFTDTGYRSLPIQWTTDPNGFLAFLTPNDWCVIVSNTRRSANTNHPIMSISACDYAGNRGWSSVSDSDRAILRGDDNPAFDDPEPEEEEEEQTTPLEEFLEDVQEIVSFLFGPRRG